VQRIVLVEPHATILVEISPDVPQQKNIIANVDEQKTDPYVNKHKV
jgi:hypothetical protein